MSGGILLCFLEIFLPGMFESLPLPSVTHLFGGVVGKRLKVQMHDTWEMNKCSVVASTQFKCVRLVAVNI